MTTFLLMNGDQLEMNDDEFPTEMEVKGALLVTSSSGDILVEDDTGDDEDAVDEDDDLYYILNPDYKFTAEDVAGLFASTE